MDSTRRTFIKAAALPALSILSYIRAGPEGDGLFMYCGKCRKPVLRFVGNDMGSLKQIKARLKADGVIRSADWESLDDPAYPKYGSTSRPCHHCGKPFKLTLNLLRPQDG